MNKTKLFLFVSLFSLTSISATASTLVDVYQQALENDTLMRANEARYQAGKEYSRIARAAMLPEIDLNASYTKNDQDTTDNLTNIESSTDSTNKSWSANLSQTLFDMSVWYQYKRGNILSEQAEAQFGADQQDLIVRVAEAYFNVLRAIDHLEASIAEENALAQQLNQAKQRFDVGLIAITEVHEAQASYDSATAATLQARGLVGIRFEELEVITGREERGIAPLAADFPILPPSPADRSEWVEFALQNNYLLKASRLNAEASHQNAKATSADRLPTVRANASYTESDNDGDAATPGSVNPFDRTVEGSQIGVSLNVPLFGRARTALTRQAYASYTEAQELYNNTQRNTIQTARSLHLTLETDVARVKARKQAIVSNQSALEATQSGYEVGTRNLVELLLAQRNLYQARRDYSDALYDYVIDSFKLREVAGILTPADIQAVDKWLQANRLKRRDDF